jgi:hypothetical protein
VGSDPVIEYWDNLFLDAYDSGRVNVLWRDDVEAVRGAGPESIESGIVEARSTGDAVAEGEFIDIVAVAVIPPRRSKYGETRRIQRRWTALACCLPSTTPRPLSKPTSAAADS